MGADVPVEAVGIFLVQVDAGQLQTVCTALVALGPERTRINEVASEKQIESWLHSYLGKLSFPAVCMSPPPPPAPQPGSPGATSGELAFPRPSAKRHLPRPLPFHGLQAVTRKPSPLLPLFTFQPGSPGTVFGSIYHLPGINYLISDSCY